MEPDIIYERVSMGDLVKIKDKYKKKVMKAYKLSKEAITSFFKVVGRDPGILIVVPVEHTTGKQYRMTTDLLTPAKWQNWKRMRSEDMSPRKRITVKEVHNWFKGLEENKWRKTYPVDSRRIAYFVNNHGLTEDEQRPMPQSLMKKNPNASYKREQYYANKFIEYKESKNLEESLRLEIRSILREMSVGMGRKTKFNKNSVKKYNKSNPMVLVNGHWYVWEDGDTKSVFVSNEDGKEYEFPINQVELVEEGIFKESTLLTERIKEYQNLKKIDGKWTVEKLRGRDYEPMDISKMLKIKGDDCVVWFIKSANVEDFGHYFIHPNDAKEVAKTYRGYKVFIGKGVIDMNKVRVDAKSYRMLRFRTKKRDVSPLKNISGKFIKGN